MAVTDILGEIDGDETSGLDRSEILGDLLDGDESGLEFVGDDSGDDLGDDILGAAIRKRKAQKNQALASALARRRAAAGTLVRDVRPRSSREYALGLGNTSVLGNSSANINVQPQVVFRPERVLIPSNVALDFLITDIKVGKNSQLASTGAVPATAFTEQAFGVRLKMDTAQISMFVTLSVTNTNPNARNFQGVIIGPAIE